MAPVNHFERLGIDIGANEEQVKKAYRTMAKKWHPDKCKEANAKEKFQEIAASYEYLSSKDRREMHERELRNPKPPPKPQPPPQTQTHTQSSTKTSKPASTSSNSDSAKKEKTKPNKASWSETFTKNYRSQQAKQGKTDSKPDGPRPHFSFTTDTGAGTFRFMFSDFSGDRRHSTYSSAAEDVFDEFLGGIFSTMGFEDDVGGLDDGYNDILGGPTKSQKKKPRKRHVAPEKGAASGLDEEYLFTSPRNKEEYTEELPCPWCGQLFTRGKLAQHEEKCGKFGLSADEDEDDDGDDCSDDDFSYYSSVATPDFFQRPKWETQRMEMMAKIRRDKQKYKDRVASQGTRNSGYVQCPNCDRTFNHVAGAKHIPWCTEHTRKYGQPASPRYSYNMPGMGEWHREEEDGDKIFRAKKGHDTGARERAREYAKKVPRPTAKKAPPEGRDGVSHSPRDGNQRRFPPPRSKKTDDSEYEFGVHGTRVGERPPRWHKDGAARMSRDH